MRSEGHKSHQKGLGSLFSSLSPLLNLVLLANLVSFTTYSPNPIIFRSYWTLSWSILLLALPSPDSPTLQDGQRQELQSTIHRLMGWSVEWQMLFNSDKYHILHLGPRNARYEYTMEGRVLEGVESENVVGGHCAPESEAKHAVCQGNGEGQRHPVLG